ncbi:MAG TPA: hypothetical protein VGM83_22170 [Devosiaceae bacterium]|jgi:hypothetical protein
MLGLQPYETFQLLVENGGNDRANTLLMAACDAFSRRARPTPSELEQFEALSQRLFQAAAPEIQVKAAQLLGRSAHLSELLENLVLDNVGDGLPDYLIATPSLSEATQLKLLAAQDVTSAAAIARRPDLNNVVLAKLFGMNSRKVYRALATNTSIVPRGAYLSALARSAQMDHQVAFSLAARDDFDCGLLAPAFFDLGESDRIKVIKAFAERKTPSTPIQKTIEQLSVATGELSRALMKLFSENRRPEVTRLLNQITGLDELRCGQISHDTSGAALFVVLRAFGCSGYEGLKVLIHATSHDMDRSPVLAEFAQLFETVEIEAMAFLMSSWRGDVNLLDLAKPEYRPFTQESRRTPVAAPAVQRSPLADQAMEALSRIGARRAG